MDIIKLSQMSWNELTKTMREMTEEELEALLTLIEKLKDRRTEIMNYLLEI